jgi:hypothetical protein
MFLPIYLLSKQSQTMMKHHKSNILLEIFDNFFIDGKFQTKYGYGYIHLKLDMITGLWSPYILKLLQDNLKFNLIHMYTMEIV